MDARTLLALQVTIGEAVQSLRLAAGMAANHEEGGYYRDLMAMAERLEKGLEALK